MPNRESERKAAEFNALIGEIPEEGLKIPYPNGILTPDSFNSFAWHVRHRIPTPPGRIAIAESISVDGQQLAWVRYIPSNSTPLIQSDNPPNEKKTLTGKQYRDRTRKSRVVDHVLQDIKNHRLGITDRLLTKTELAELYKVHETSISYYLRFLPQEEKQYRRKVFVGRGFDTKENENPDNLSEQEGLLIIYNFLTGKIPHNSLAPFILDLTDRDPTNSHSRSFYVGKHHKEVMQISLHPSTFEYSPYILAYPRAEMSKGLTPYYWLDFYDLADREKNIPIQSSRLLPGNQPTIDSRHWRSLGEQLLVDFAHKNNGIQFEDLIAFYIDFRLMKASVRYRFGTLKDLQIRLPDTFAQEDHNILQVVPAQSRDGKYQWINLVTNSNDTDGGEIIASYQFIANETGVSFKTWEGYEKQILLDFLSNSPEVKFEDLVPIEMTKSNGGDDLIILDSKNRNNIIFYYPKGAIQKGDRVLIIPKQDDRGLYQWLELFKIDPTTNKPEARCISSERIIDGKLIKANWYGPERQLLIDYSHNQVPFHFLKEVLVRVSNTKSLYLWYEQEASIQLHLSNACDLHEGDEVSLVPIYEYDDKTTFKIRKQGINLAEYEFDRITKKFTLRHIESLDLQNISPEEAGRRFLESLGAI